MIVKMIDYDICGHDSYEYLFECNSTNKELIESIVNKANSLVYDSDNEGCEHYGLGMSEVEYLIKKMLGDLGFSCRWLTTDLEVMI